jgi:hypothetical protein
VSQEAILTYLRNLRVMGDEEFYSIKHIARELGYKYYPTWQKVNKLFAWGDLEVKVIDWKRSFRAKER